MYKKDKMWIALLLLLVLVPIMDIYHNFRERHTKDIEWSIAHSNLHIAQDMLTLQEQIEVDNRTDTLICIYDVCSHLDYSEQFYRIYCSNYMFSDDKLDDYLALLSSIHIYIDAVTESVMDESITASDVETIQQDIGDAVALLTEIDQCEAKTFWQKTENLDIAIQERAQNSENMIWKQYLRFVG